MLAQLQTGYFKNDDVNEIFFSSAVYKMHRTNSSLWNKRVLVASEGKLFYLSIVPEGFTGTK